MPFLAPFVPALIKGGIGIGAGLLGKQLAKSSPTERETGVLNQLQPLMNQAAGQSSRLFDMGQQASQRPINYWTGLLSGNRAGMTSLLSPEIDQIHEGARAAGQASAMLQPRGGATADVNLNRPYETQRDIQTLFQRLRPMAASQLGGMAGTFFGNATQSIYGATQAGRELLGYEQRRRDSKREAGRNIGGTIFDIVQGLPNIGGGGGKGGSAEDWLKWTNPTSSR